MTVNFPVSPLKSSSHSNTPQGSPVKKKEGPSFVLKKGGRRLSFPKVGSSVQHNTSRVSSRRFSSEMSPSLSDRLIFQRRKLTTPGAELYTEGKAQEEESGPCSEKMRQALSQTLFGTRNYKNSLFGGTSLAKEVRAFRSEDYPTSPEHRLDTPGAIIDFHKNLCGSNHEFLLSLSLTTVGEDDVYKVFYRQNSPPYKVFSLSKTYNYGEVPSYTISQCGKMILIGKHDGMVEVFRRNPRNPDEFSKEKSLSSNIDDWVISIDTSRNGTVVWGCTHGKFCILFPGEQIPKKYFIEGFSKIVNLKLSPDGLFLAISFSVERAETNPSTGGQPLVNLTQLFSLDPFTKKVKKMNFSEEIQSELRALAFHPNRKFLAIGGGVHDPRMIVYSFEKGSLKREISYETGDQIREIIWDEPQRLISIHHSRGPYDSTSQKGVIRFFHVSYANKFSLSKPLVRRSKNAFIYASLIREGGASLLAIQTDNESIDFWRLDKKSPKQKPMKGLKFGEPWDQIR